MCMQMMLVQAWYCSHVASMVCFSVLLGGFSCVRAIDFGCASVVPWLCDMLLCLLGGFSFVRAIDFGASVVVCIDGLLLCLVGGFFCVREIDVGNASV